MQDIYLNSEQAAAYLGIKERKLYELVGAGRIPATKATGKWLFPRAALDRWLEAGLVIPPGYAPRLPPKIIAGSQDPLLDWAARRSGSGLALLAEGSEAGLRHLEQNDAAMAAIHLHTSDSAIDDAESNVEAVRASPHLADAVVIHFAAREQGLMMRFERKIGSVGDAVAQGLVFGARQAGAGAQLLLEKLIAAENQTIAALNKRDTAYATGEDLAFGIASGEVDCGIATRAVAEQAALAFVPLLWEEFDLVIRRRTFFEPAPQAFFEFLRGQAFHDHARALGGYRTDRTGQVRFNR